VSEAVKRLRAAIVDVLTEDVRDAIRNGATIEQIVERFAVPKRFVEDQRLILKETETIPDARVVTGSGESIRRMHKEGYTAREIAKELGVSTAYVYQQRRKLK
jgi:DNA-binding NarL/FixJ family response regulator